jgi:hypothetical protein
MASLDKASCDPRVALNRHVTSDVASCVLCFRVERETDETTSSKGGMRSRIDLNFAPRGIPLPSIILELQHLRLFKSKQRKSSIVHARQWHVGYLMLGNFLFLLLLSAVQSCVKFNKTIYFPTANWKFHTFSDLRSSKDRRKACSPLIWQRRGFKTHDQIIHHIISNW